VNSWTTNTSGSDTPPSSCCPPGLALSARSSSQVRATR
jgi:hypothetical protein